MKSLNIKSQTIARELGYLAACFAVAFGANLYAVIAYHRPWTELFTQIGFVVVITAALFIYIAILRGIWHLLRMGFMRIKTSNK